MDNQQTGNVNFNESFLITGKNLALDKNLIVKHPTVGEIFNLGNGLYYEDAYWSFVQVLTSDPYNYMVELDDDGIDYATMQPFDLFIYHFKKYSKDKKSNFFPIMLDAIHFFLGMNYLIPIYLDDIKDYVLVDNCNLDENKQPNLKVLITRQHFNMIVSFIKAINKISDEDQIKPATVSLRKMLVQDKREEIQMRLKHPDKNDDYIGKLISATCFGSHCFSIMDLDKIKIYWLFEALHIANNKDYTDHLLNGMYFGTVDSSKINKEELNWIK